MEIFRLVRFDIGGSCLFQTKIETSLFRQLE